MLTIERTEEMVSVAQKIPGDIWDTLITELIAGKIPASFEEEAVGPNKCKGRDCNDRDECARYVSPERYFQWYDNYDMYRESDGSCTYKLPVIEG